MSSKQFIQVIAALALLFAILACNGQATPEVVRDDDPPPLPPTEPLPAPSTATPFPTPTATDEPLPTASPPPTATEEPAPPPNVNLPPLPDFSGSVLTYGPGGGPLCDNHYDGPPALWGGSNVWVPARTGYLCLYGINFDTNFRIEMTAPDNSILLGGSYYVNGHDFGVYWRNFNLSDFGSDTSWLAGVTPGGIWLVEKAATRLFIRIRWHGDLPNDYWKTNVFTDSDQISGEFNANSPELPALEVVDSRKEWIMPAYNFCYLADEPQDLQALGRGYPSNQEIYLYVYEQNEGLVFQSSARTDANGDFFTGLAGPYHANGQYFVLGLTEPLSSPDPGAYGNKVDCFYVP